MSDTRSGILTSLGHSEVWSTSKRHGTRQKAEEAAQAEPRGEDRDRSACERHITVTVAREDIDRYFDKEYSELMPTAQVPGFRPGHAPRKLIEHRFHKDVAERVRAALLMDSLARFTRNRTFRRSASRTWTWMPSKCPTKGR